MNPLPLALLSLTVAAALPRAATAQQHTCAGFAIADADGVRVIDLDAQVLGTRTTQGFASIVVGPVGPRLVATDAAGTFVLDRTGAQLGFVAAMPGSFQTVELGTDRIIVVDDDRVRILDLDGRMIGTPILRTGTIRQSVWVDGDRFVVVESDRLRVFDRDGRPVGAPVQNGGSIRQTLEFDRDRIVVIDDTQVRIFDRGMHPIGAPIQNRGGTRQSVTVDGDRIVVTDDHGTQIFDRDGLRRTTIAKTGTGRQRVEVHGDRIIVIDDDRVRVFDRDGLPIGGPILTTGGTDVTVTGDRIIVTDGTQTRIFDRDGRLITSILKTGTMRQTVLVDGDRIIVIDEDRVRIFGTDGVLRGAPILRTGTDTQVVRIEGDRILVIDEDRVRIFDRDGMLRGAPILTQNVQDYDVHLFDRVFTITENGAVQVYDLEASPVGRPITVGLSVQHVQAAGGRLVIAEDHRVRLFDFTARQVGATIAARNGPQILPICFLGGSIRTFGTGCAGSGGVPSQSVFGEPRLGGVLTFFLANGPANGTALLNLGFSDQRWGGIALPFDLAPFGAGGCVLLADMVEAFPARIDSAGFAEVNVRVPAAPGLVGLDVFTQFVLPDPAANAFGLTTSDAVAVRIGEGL